MQQRVDILTLRTENVEVATDFYKTKVGWTPLLEVPHEITFFQTGPGQVLGLFNAQGFDDDIGQHAAGYSFVLAHNVESEHEVRATVETMVNAGATVLKPAQQADFGGYHAYLQDPAGICWEIAYNPGWSIADDGSVTLKPVEAS